MSRRFTRNSAFLEISGKRYVCRRERGNGDDSDDSDDSLSISEENQDNGMPLIDFGNESSYILIFLCIKNNFIRNRSLYEDIKT